MGWDDADVVEEPAQPEPKAEESAEQPSEQPATDGAKTEEAEPPPAQNTATEPESRKLVFKHWVRPKFLQYGYLYDYQKNYYDDIISYIDKRNKGLPVEKPHAQTWGERALRTYLSKNVSSYSMRSTNKDLHLLRHISTGARFHRYHSKSLISRKYSKLGFNTVSI